MSLETGDRLGRYEILGPLGAGGMGEVYRAHDERLDRDVAIKVLPEEVAQDQARLTRFEREAKLLASLSHQNIATLHGLEEHDEKSFLVMELAEGETLAERINRGPIPVDDALPIALQIAEGLEAAHEQGIIHRDLKPANVMLSPEGKVKILDFGLAKAWQLEEGDPDLTHSPTLTGQMTAAGVLLGTAAYMSPEQARGKPVDKRADIWAFGCVLWEMLTGRRAFEGETVSDTISAIIRGQPEWEAMPSDTPRSVRRTLRRCLEKDAANRLHDIADARIEIQQARTVTDREADAQRDDAPFPRRRSRIAPLAYVVVGLLAGAIIVALASLLGPEQRPPRQVIRFTIDPPASEPPPEGLSLSADGTQLIWTGAQLHHRRLDQLEAVAIPGTEGATAPFFSPDGRWAGFVNASANLCKVEIEGGEPIVLADSLLGRRATWATDDFIVFTNADGGVSRISARGGEPTILISPDPGTTELYRSPQLLEGSQALLFDTTPGSILVRDLSSGETIELSDGWDPRYVRSGHLVFSRGSAVVAAPLDLRRRQISGPPQQVLTGVTAQRFGQVPIAISENGSMAYVARKPGRLVWVDHNGIIRPVSEERALFRWPKLSPDQRRLAVSVFVGGAGSEVWLRDLHRNAFTRLSMDGDTNLMSSWTPDGESLTVTSNSDGWFNLYSQSVDGIGEPVRLTNREVPHFGGQWSHDGRFLAFAEQHPATQNDVWVLALDEARTLQCVARTAADESGPTFSPNGKWLAYSSDESGRYEIYVTPFPEADRRLQVSTDGGRQALWAPDGRTIYYRNGNRMMAAPITYEPSFEVGQPEVLFTGSFEGETRNLATYDISADGKKFLMVEVDPTDSQIVIVTNWFEELKRLVPTD
jgi:serine/threonine-protein kinase